MDKSFELKVLEEIQEIRRELKVLTNRIGNVGTEAAGRFERARDFTQKVAERVAYLEGYLETMQGPHPALSRRTGRGKKREETCSLRSLSERD
jgi:hypothetical protein